MFRLTNQSPQKKKITRVQEHVILEFMLCLHTSNLHDSNFISTEANEFKKHSRNTINRNNVEYRNEETTHSHYVIDTLYLKIIDEYMNVSYYGYKFQMSCFTSCFYMNIIALCSKVWIKFLMHVSSKLYFKGPRTPIWWNVKSRVEYELYVEILTTLVIKLRRDNKRMNYKRKLFLKLTDRTIQWSQLCRR